MTGRGGAVGGQEHTEPTDKVGGNNSFIATQHDDGVRHDGARRGGAWQPTSVTHAVATFGGRGGEQCSAGD